MTDEDVGTSLTTKHRKIPYLLGIIAAMLGYGLSLLEPSIRGPKLWAIFFCAGFAVWISVLKLRSLIHGTGWVFPRTNTALLTAVVVEVWLHLWFSH
jgi:hypothetical protein